MFFQMLKTRQLFSSSSFNVLTLKCTNAAVIYLLVICVHLGGRCCVLLRHQTWPQTGGAPRSRRCEWKTSGREHDGSQQTVLASVYVLVGIVVLPVSCSWRHLEVFMGHKFKPFCKRLSWLRAKKPDSN